jgi:hypothetical protein
MRAIQSKLAHQGLKAGEKHQGLSVFFEIRVSNYHAVVGVLIY